MRFPDPLVRGVLIKREKRFLAHVQLDDGPVVIAHTGNTGRMIGCSEPGSVVWLSPQDRPNRKLKWTWELVEAGPSRALSGINTSLANDLAEEAVRAGRVEELRGYTELRREVRYGSERSRIDLLLDGDGDGHRPRAWVEVKNVTLVVGDGLALFPDAVTERGRKHLRELAAQVALGDRGVLLFVVQRGDVDRVGPADSINPAYGAELRKAAAARVEILAWGADVTPEAVVLSRRLGVTLDGD